MTAVEDFIYQYENDQRAILLLLHDLLVNQLNLDDKIRFKIPFYYGKTWICYLNPIKTHAVELAFIRGNELSNAQGILNSKGRKQVYGISFEKVKDIDLPCLEEVLHEAMLLDETTPYKSKRKK